MNYLIFLRRFEIDEERLKEKIKSFGKNVSFKDEHEVEGSLDVNQVISLQEVEHLVVLKTEWCELNFTQLKKDALSAVKNEKSVYKIQTKFHDKIPLSAKSLYKHINPYLKHEGFTPDEKNWDSLVYLELKKENNKVFYRMGISERRLWEKAVPLKVDMKNINIILENPSLKDEVSDFLRLCWIFKLPLTIVTQNKGFEKLLKKAKEETKGIDEEFKVRIVEKFPNDGVLVGFSKHAQENESQLRDFFKRNKEKVYLLFGDDKFGLTQEARDKVNHTFRLTPEVKKPLRASHALSYILGFYTAEKL